jgi:hypothetical protein
MKNKKRLLLIVLMTVAVVTANAQQYAPESDFDAKVINGGRGVEIIKYVGSKQTVNIPPTMEGIPVTSIGLRAFSDCANLTSVTIPASVTSIGSQAFNSFTNLTAINVSVLNANYRSEEGVLFNINKTTLIQYPAKKEGTTFTIPASVTRIGNRAFYNCANLTSVTIPASVTSIESQAFSFNSLTAINVSALNANYRSEEGVLFNRDKTTLIQYPAKKEGTTFTIPTSVTSIGEWAFLSCANLTSITIPNNVTSIGVWAFRDCTSLASVTFQGKVDLSDSYAFMGDLLAKFYGTPGTYTTTAPVEYSSVWTKQ